jgi:hypothetical protein
MDRRKAGYILLLMLTLPSLALPVSASTGNPISNFVNNLLLIVPPVLFIMSILALRKADYDYAFTLLLASIIVTVALSAFQTQVNSQGLMFYSVELLVAGPTKTTVKSQVSYSVHQLTLPSGFSVQSSNYNWVILYNYSVVVFNSSSGQVNSQYVSGVSASDNSLTFTPTQPGVYAVLYSITYKGTESGIPAYAIGSGGVQLQVSPPLSGWNWLTNAVISAVSSFFLNSIGSMFSIASLIGSYLVNIFSYALMSPTMTYPWKELVLPIYYEILQTSISLSLLLIAGTVAYNALKNNYSDIIDIASDLLYKIGVWLLFTFGGLEIYNYSAIFLNDLIENILNLYAPLLIGEFSYGVAVWVDLTAVGIVPFFFDDLKTFIGDALYAFAIAGTLVIVRYFMILAIVALIPLLSTLWIFEWTRKIADALIDILIGLMVAGLVNTLLLSFFVATGGFIFFFLLPYVVDLGTIASVGFMLFTIRPHEQLNIPTSRGKRGSGSSGSSGNQASGNQP